MFTLREDALAVLGVMAVGSPVTIKQLVRDTGLSARKARSRVVWLVQGDLVRHAGWDRPNANLWEITDIGREFLNEALK